MVLGALQLLFLVFLSAIFTFVLFFKKKQILKKFNFTRKNQFSKNSKRIHFEIFKSLHFCDIFETSRLVACKTWFYSGV